jgi:hypothetical protein
MVLKFASPLGLNATISAVQDSKAYAQIGMDTAKALHLCESLWKAFVRELTEIKFLRATPDMVEYLEREHPFGPEVSIAFPDCIEDIDEANKCFAIERYTATVFHLGRTMEKLTARVAKKLKAKPRDDWQKNLNAIDDAIKLMGYGTKQQREKRAVYMEFSAFSMRFKEAWRNRTAHPKQSYTRQEALNIMLATAPTISTAAIKIFRAKVPAPP